MLIARASEYSGSIWRNSKAFLSVYSTCFHSLILFLLFYLYINQDFTVDFFLCTGAAKSTWIRIPVIIYSSHVVTTLIAIFYHMLTSDFTNSKYPGPATMKERLTLMSIYSPYFIIPLLNLCDACFSSAYKEVKKIKRQ